MKRLIPAVILLIFVISSYFLSYYYIRNTCHDVKILVDKCEEEYLNNDTKAHETAKKLEKVWGKKEKVLSFFVNHDRVDEIELTLSSLTSFSESDDTAMFNEYSSRIKMLLHQLKEDSSISTHSIF